MSTAPTTPESTTDGPALTYPAGLPDDVSPLGERAAGAFRATLIVTGAAGLILLVGAIIDARQFFHSYLFGYVLALSVSLGALFWVLIHHVSDAGWSVGLRRVYENVTLAILPLAGLFLPVAVGIYTGNLHAWHGF